MLNIFGGPFHDEETKHAFRAIQDTPHLIVDSAEQQRRYATKFLDILKHHGKHRIFQVTPTTVKSNGRKIDIVNILYPQEPARIFPNSDWTNKPTKKRIPYFSLFHIGGSHG